MARIREFDYEKAMEKAMHLFWKTGYANTSLRDLLKAMGIGEGSFYNTFKSKKNAYLECLKHYDATVNAERVRAFTSQPTAAEGVRALFRAILNCLDNPRLPKVCLLAGAIAPDVLAEKELRAYMREQATGWAIHMATRFDAEKKQRILPQDFDSQTVATIIVTFIQGLWRMALISYDRPKLERQIDRLLTALKL
jgi:TetR/AcrR family transcriptional repressor of nem operon